MIVSVPLFLEYEDVLLRQETREEAALTRQEVDTVLNAIAARAERATSRYSWRPQLRDPNDEMVLETAIAGRADAIATFNRRDFGEGPRRFGIGLDRPAQIVRRFVDG